MGPDKAASSGKLPTRTRMQWMRPADNSDAPLTPLLLAPLKFLPKVSQAIVCQRISHNFYTKRHNRVGNQWTDSQPTASLLPHCCESAQCAQILMRKIKNRVIRTWLNSRWLVLCARHDDYPVAIDIRFHWMMTRSYSSPSTTQITSKICFEAIHHHTSTTNSSSKCN